MRPVHFEIHAADPERCAGFYRDVFGWEIERIQAFEYWLVRTGEGEPGIDGGILRRMGENPDPAEPTPVVASVLTVQVPDVDATIEKIRAGGGTEALPKAHHPGIGLLAYWKDTESNLFGVLQPEGG